MKRVRSLTNCVEVMKGQRTETDMVWDPAEFKFQDQSRPSWNY